MTRLCTFASPALVKEAKLPVGCGALQLVSASSFVTQKARQVVMFCRLQEIPRARQLLCKGGFVAVTKVGFQTLGKKQHNLNTCVNVSLCGRRASHMLRRTLESDMSVWQ
jgi:hypothetical protein